MFNYESLSKRYESDVAFNRLVNAFRDAIEKFGFLPSEIREAAFLAQMHVELYKAQQILRSENEWEKTEEARKILQQSLVDIRQLFGDDDEKA